MKFLPDQPITTIPQLSTRETVAKLISMGIQVTSSAASPDAILDDDTGEILSVNTDGTQPWMFFNGSLYRVNPSRFARAMILLSLHDDTEPLTPFDLARYGAYDVLDVASGDGDYDDLSVYRSSRVFDTTNYPVKDSFPGATVVLGMTGAGKTYYVRNTLNSDVIIRYGEPMEDVDSTEGVISVSTIGDVFSLAAVLAAVGARVAVDSIRPLVYNMRGKAGGGGVSTGIYIALTSISNFYAAFGNNIILTLNPLVTSDEKAVELYTVLAAASSGAIYIADQAVRAEQHRLVTGRVLSVGEANIRDRKDVTPDTVVHADVSNLGDDTPMSQASIRLGRDGYAKETNDDSDARYDTGPASLANL